jgi:hypothetical protein
MTGSVLVSVLVTARDNERHARIAVESVLRQTAKHLELLVVDDGSQDSTRCVLASIRDPRLTVIRHEESAGIVARRNELVEQARGRYVAPLDADDVWLPDRLERHVALLEATPELVAVGSDLLVVDDQRGVGDYLRLPRSDAAIRWCCLFTSPAIHSAVTIRRTAFDNGVRYDPAYPLTQDFDLWTKLLRMGGARNLDRPLSLYRRHGSQATVRRIDEQRREQEQIGCRAVEELAGDAGVSGERARLAWCLGAGAPLHASELVDAIDAYGALFACFAERRGGAAGIREARRIAATSLLRRAGASRSRAGWSLRRDALRVDPTVPVTAAVVRATNLAEGRRHRRRVERYLAELESGGG